MAKYVQPGEVIDIVPNKNLKAGEPYVFGSRIGIAGCDMESGKLGTLHVKGVFEFDTTATIAAGAEVSLVDGKIAASGGTKAGYAVKASEGGKIWVSINA